MKNFIRYWFARFMWRLQCRKLHLCRKLGINLGYCGGRRVDWIPMICEECGWRGPLRWCYHTYGDDGSGEDVEPVDECPHCFREDLVDYELYNATTLSFFTRRYHLNRPDRALSRGICFLLRVFVPSCLRNG